MNQPAGASRQNNTTKKGDPDMTDMFAEYKKEQAAKAAEKSASTAPSESSASPASSSAQPAQNRKFEYLHRGAFTMLKVHMDAGERMKAESDAMVAMSPNISVEGKLEGGVLGGLGRMLSGEKFFFQTLHAQHGPGELYLSPAIPGDLMDIPMDGSVSYILQKDGFFAGSEDLQISTKMQNLAKGLFSGEGFFILRATGRGTLFVSSYGAIHPIDLAAGEEIIIDNSHLVAWPETMQYSIEKASSGWISSFTSGEGLVCRFKGPGRVLIQTRNPGGFGSWIRRFLPAK